MASITIAMNASPLRPIGGPFSYPLVYDGAIPTSAESFSGNNYKCMRVRSSIPGSKVYFTVDDKNFRAIAYVKVGFRIVQVQGGFVFMTKAAAAALEMQMALSPHRDFVLESMGNLVQRVSPFVAPPTVPTKYVMTTLFEPAQKVIDPDVDCSCGGSSKFGYPKGNAGHARWCAWA